MILFNGQIMMYSQWNRYCPDLSTPRKFILKLRVDYSIGPKFTSLRNLWFMKRYLRAFLILLIIMATIKLRVLPCSATARQFAWVVCLCWVKMAFTQKNNDILGHVTLYSGMYYACYMSKVSLKNQWQYSVTLSLKVTFYKLIYSDDFWSCDQCHLAEMNYHGKSLSLSDLLQTGL